MRTYQAIWHQIKRDSKATVLSARPMHNRLIEAVRKEKKLDISWKFLMAEKHKRYKLKQIISNDRVEFYLEEHTILNIHIL